MNSSTSPVDIRPDHLEIVRDILRAHLPAGFKVWVFGSRANWTTKDSSDLDLAVEGSASLADRAMVGLEAAFEESHLPYAVDVVDLKTVSNAFKQIVDDQRVPLPLRSAPEKLNGAWREMLFSEAVLVNPPTRLDRGAVYPFVEMAAVNADSRTTVSVEERTFKGSGSRFQSGDTLMARITPCLENGKIARYQTVGDKLETHGSTEFIVIRGRPNVTDNNFAYYLTKWEEVRNYAIGQLTGTSGRQRIPVDSLDHLTVPLPPLPEQRAIAHILGTLDDKIELNQRMNETLEAMAWAMFKSWFVDFDPVRAKMEGRWCRGESLPGLPDDLYDLFPDRLVDSELGRIPERWGVGVLNDVIELLSGGTPKTSVPGYWGGDIPWYAAKDAPNGSDVFALATERTITQSGVKNSATRILAAGTTVITARGTVGRLACLGVPMAMNQTCYGIRGGHGYPDFFTYWNLRTAVDELQTRTHGTIFDTITRQTFTLVGIALAPVELTLAFEAMVEPIMAHILNNLKEARSLAAQRDVLLPGLLSGRVRVQPE